MQEVLASSAGWDHISVRLIQDMYRLTGACVLVEDGSVKDFFNEEERNHGKSKDTGSGSS
jgi:hypothetical protein